MVHSHRNQKSLARDDCRTQPDGIPTTISPCLQDMWFHAVQVSTGSVETQPPGGIHPDLGDRARRCDSPLLHQACTCNPIHEVHAVFAQPTIQASRWMRWEGSPNAPWSSTTLVEGLAPRGHT